MLSITPILTVGVLGFGHNGKAFDSRSGAGGGEVPCPNSRHPHVLPSSCSLFFTQQVLCSCLPGWSLYCNSPLGSVFNDTSVTVELMSMEKWGNDTEMASVQYVVCSVTLCHFRPTKISTGIGLRSNTVKLLKA